MGFSSGYGMKACRRHRTVLCCRTPGECPTEQSLAHWATHNIPITYKDKRASPMRKLPFRLAVQAQEIHESEPQINPRCRNAEANVITVRVQHAGGKSVSAQCFDGLAHPALRCLAVLWQGTGGKLLVWVWPCEVAGSRSNPAHYSRPQLNTLGFMSKKEP